jgi:hypothetical protein
LSDDGGTNHTPVPLATYTVDPSGNLDLVRDSGVIPAVQERKIAFDPSGRYLALAGYVGQEGVNQQAAVQVYRLQPDGRLVQVGPPSVVAQTYSFESLAWDLSNHVYAVPSCRDSHCTRDGAPTGLYIFDVSENGVTIATGSPHIVNYVRNVAVVPAK